jgi:hypothetical protein
MAVLQDRRRSPAPRWSFAIHGGAGLNPVIERELAGALQRRA